MGPEHPPGEAAGWTGFGNLGIAFWAVTYSRNISRCFFSFMVIAGLPGLHFLVIQGFATYFFEYLGHQMGPIPG